MNARIQIPMKSNWAPQIPGILRRKCACGGSGGTCPECEQKKLQRRAAGDGPQMAPHIVHDVLRSPGQLLDAKTRAYFEPRFGHDFSKVRVHTDAKASESAETVNAFAYTVGQDVAFASGYYSPHTRAGARLLAHELAHTVQNPEPAGIHPFLRIGRASDPSEQVADHAADAVMRNERAFVASSGGPVLRRQERNCTADEPGAADDPNLRNVHCSDGSVYRVKLTTTPQAPSPTTRFSMNAGLNDTELFVTAEICRGGTEVQLTPNLKTADLSQAFARSLTNILARSGALSGVTLSPDLSITVIQSKSFTITLDPNLMVGQSGAVGGGGGITVQTRHLTLRLGGTYDAQNRTSGITLDISGGKAQPNVSCTKVSEPHLAFTCEQTKHTPSQPAQADVGMKWDMIVRHLFFHYPTANIRRDFHLPDDIQKLYDDGYRFQRIDGFTSPEGPRGREHEPKFEGNIELAKERAKSALNWLRLEACPQCDLTHVTLSGQSELPPELGKVIPEPKGPGMERAAVSEFLGETPGTTADPLAPKGPAELEAFHRMLASQQRDRAFELMRRATITMLRFRPTLQIYEAIPEQSESKSVGCDPHVIDAARKSFGISKS